MAAEAQDLVVLSVQKLERVPGNPLAEPAAGEVLVVLGRPHGLLQEPNKLLGAKDRVGGR